MIFRLFSPHGHGQCKAMRYISKHEADVYLDKEEKTQSGLRTEKKGLDSSAFFKCQVWTTLQWSQFPFLHNAVGRSCVCFAFLYSSLKIRMQGLSPQMGKNKEIDNNLKQSPLVKTASRKIYYTLKLNLKNKTTWIITSNMSHLHKYMHVKWL